MLGYTVAAYTTVVVAVVLSLVTFVRSENVGKVAIGLGLTLLAGMSVLTLVRVYAGTDGTGDTMRDGTGGTMRDGTGTVGRSKSVHFETPVAPKVAPPPRHPRPDARRVIDIVDIPERPELVMSR